MPDSEAAKALKPRITLSVSAEGMFEVWLNKEGRDLLVAELLALSESNDHFHLDGWEGAEVELRTQPYRATDKIVDVAKVLFRTDIWDREHFPHVMENSTRE